MSRTVKRLIYGTVYLVIALLLLSGIYAIWFRKTPTCSDNIQNQGETGIDCGGPCIPCAEKDLKIDTSIDPIALQSGQDQSVVLVTLKDDSSDYGVKFSYNVIVHNVIGQQADAFTGTSYILPSSPRYLVFTGIADNVNDIGEIDPAITDVTWISSAKMEQYDLSIGGISTQVGQSGGYVGGTISNETASGVGDVRLVAILYDASGKVVSASKGDIIAGLTAFSNQTFQVFFPVMDIRTANSIDKARTEVFYEVIEN